MTTKDIKGQMKQKKRYFVLCVCDQNPPRYTLPILLIVEIFFFRLPAMKKTQIRGKENVGSWLASLF